MTEETQRTKGERTRRAVLDAAKSLFLCQGYAATSMRQIARAVGITPAAIYNHFASKDGIFTALLQEAAPLEEALELLQKTEADTLEDLLRETVRAIVGLFANHEDYIRLALIDAQERDGTAVVTFPPQLFPHFMAFYQRLAALDADRGQLRDLSPFVFNRTLFSLIAGYIITEYVAKPARTLNLPNMDWVEGLMDIFLHGVLKSLQPEA